MAKTLLLMRHAKSSWKDKKLSDFDRPLKRRGVKAAKLMGKVLTGAELVPQLVLSSPAERAKQTAEIVSKEMGFKGKLALVESFYMAEPRDYLNALASLPDEIERVLLVGHNPGLEDLANGLDGRAGEMPPGAVAYFSLSIKHWSDLNRLPDAELISFWDPGDVDLEELEAEMGKDKDKKDKDKKDKKKDKKDKKKGKK